MNKRQNLKNIAQKHQKRSKENPHQPDKEFEKKQQEGRPEDGEMSEMEKIKSSMLADEAISGSFYYLFGVVFAYFKLNGHEPPAPQKVMEKFKEMNEIDPEDQRQYLRNSDDVFHEFLEWYFYGSRES